MEGGVLDGDLDWSRGYLVNYRDGWLITDPGGICCMRGKTLSLLLMPERMTLPYRHSQRPRTFNVCYLSQQTQRAA